MRTKEPRRRAAVGSLLTLRPLLFLVAFFFVLLPLIVYNVFTLDYAQALPHVLRDPLRLNGGADGSDQQLQTPQRLRSEAIQCLRVPSESLLTSEAVQRIAAACAVPSEEETTPKTSSERLVHFIHVPLQAVPLVPGERPPAKEEFSYLAFAAVQSIRKAAQPTRMVLHYPATEPRGVWYTQCQRHLSLHRVQLPELHESLDMNVYQRRQLLEFLLLLRALRKQGGVAFSDFHTLLLRPISQLWDQFGVVASLSPVHDDSLFGVGVHTMQAQAGNAFVTYLEAQLLDMAKRGDHRLMDLPLEQVVGQLTIQQHQQDSSKTQKTVMAGAVMGTSDLFEHVGVHNLKTLLTASVTDQSINLRRMAGFHLDAYDFHTKDTNDKALLLLEELRQSNTKVDTLFGAILRFAVSANTTAELDPHLSI